ncbi:glycosyltransferase family 2 protein [Bacillota bacterium LX-D]|nr:glycosyltransferase family 2 protein [Bacillota bacterium LX-D]
MSQRIFLSVVIPAYNEEKRLPKTLQKISSFLQGKDYAYEILVVNDGSKDGTKQVAEDFQKKDLNIRVIDNPQNMGKGYAVRNGMLQARGQYFLFTDSDLSTPIEELDKFWSKFQEGYQVVIGSRALKNSVIKVSQPFYRVLMGKTFNVIVRFLFWTRIKDTQCGFKCFTQEAAQAVFPKQQIWGFGFDVEVLFIARKLGYKICEYPVEWVNSPDTRVSALKDSLKMFWELLKIRSSLRKIKKH